LTQAWLKVHLNPQRFNLNTVIVLLFLGLLLLATFKLIGLKGKFNVELAILKQAIAFLHI